MLTFSGEADDSC